MNTVLQSGATGPAPRRRLPLKRIAAGLLISYALVLIVPHFLPVTGPFARTFNSMLDHLLRGRFDVDPAIVGPEGFARDGRVYAYWGPIPALLRLPVTVLPRWRQLDFTFPYCAVALFWMGTVKIWTVRFVLRERPDIRRSVGVAIYAAILLSGAQMCFLRLSLYQEVCLWAGLFGAVFVAAAIIAQHRGLGRRERLVMALAAGAALLTRVSIGIGLIAAFALLLATDLVIGRDRIGERVRQSLLPVAVVAIAVLLAGWVNDARWGNPLTFADYQYYLFNRDFPDRLYRTAHYGLFNIARIPFGLIYYFAPVWVLHGSDGRFLFDAVRVRLIDSVELPPSSFLLTDALLLSLAGSALLRWCRRRDRQAARGLAIAAGLAIPPLLMLTAISMCFRYRMDFYPVLEFLAFSGLAMIGPGSALARPRWAWALAAISIVSSVTVCTAYLAGKLGPAQTLIDHDVGTYYRRALGLG